MTLPTLDELEAVFASDHAFDVPSGRNHGVHPGCIDPANASASEAFDASPAPAT